MAGWPYFPVAEHSESESASIPGVESATPARSDPTVELDTDSTPGSEYTNESSYKSAGSSSPKLASRTDSCSNPCRA